MESGYGMGFCDCCIAYNINYIVRHRMDFGSHNIPNGICELFRMDEPHLNPYRRYVSAKNLSYI